MGSRTNRSQRWARLVGGLGLAALAALVPATGHAWTDTLTRLTFDRPVALPGVQLPAGQYAFEALRQDVVRVTSRDGRRVFYTGFTYRVPRPVKREGEVMVSLGEATRNSPPPITVWYPKAGDGHQFIYP
jgi:hypothetical protein